MWGHIEPPQAADRGLFPQKPPSILPGWSGGVGGGSVRGAVPGDRSWVYEGLSGNVRAESWNRDSSAAFLGNPRASAPLSAGEEFCLSEHFRNPHRQGLQLRHCGYMHRVQAGQDRACQGTRAGAGISPAGWVFPPLGCGWVSAAMHGLCVFWLQGGETGEAQQREEHTALSARTRTPLCGPGRGCGSLGLWAE